MTPIAQALALGYGAEQVLNFIERAFPKYKTSIKKSKEAGFPIERILNFIDRTMGGKQQNSGTTAQQAIHQRHKEEEETAKGLYKAGLGALGSYGALKALPTIAQGIKSTLGIGPKPMSNAPGISLPESSLSETSINNEVPLPNKGVQSPPSSMQTPSPIQSQQPNQISPSPTSQTPLQQNLTSSPQPNLASPKEKANAIITKLGINETIDKLSKSNKNLETITKDVIKSLSPQQKEEYQKLSRSGQIPPMIQLVKDYLTTGMPETARQLSTEPTQLIPSVEIDEKNQQIENRPSQIPQKGDIAALPNGEVGEIKSSRNGKALIESDGKLHQVNENEIETPSENIIETVHKLLNIPEIDRSSVISYWAYDPQDEELFVQFHNGETFKYLEASKETIENLARAEGIPVTEGENIFGAWSPEDKKSVGATMIQQIIANPKYKKPKKGEPANPYYRQLRKGYDYWSSLRTQPKRKK